MENTFTISCPCCKSGVRLIANPDDKTIKVNGQQPSDLIKNLEKVSTKKIINKDDEQKTVDEITSWFLNKPNKKIEETPVEVPEKNEDFEDV